MNVVQRGLARGCLSILAAASCSLAAACSPATDGPAGFCGWMGTDVEGLEPFVTEDGAELVETWHYIFSEGVTDADDASRRAIAEAVAADQAGFERVRDEARESVRPALGRLYDLLQDPVEAKARSVDPSVLEDVALIEAQGCDFLRNPT